jgi:hypothetical protein
LNLGTFSSLASSCSSGSFFSFNCEISNIMYES